MERQDPDKKEKGKLTIENKTGEPLDPDSAAIEFAKEIAEEGNDVEVVVRSLDPEEKPEDSSD